MYVHVLLTSKEKPAPVNAVCNLISFRFSPDVLNDPSISQIIHMLIVMVCNNEYIGNPYLTAKLVEVIFVMNPSIQRRTGTLNEQFLLHPLAVKHLVPALMKFYTGNYYYAYFFSGNPDMIELDNWKMTRKSVAFQIDKFSSLMLIEGGL